VTETNDVLSLGQDVMLGANPNGVAGMFATEAKQHGHSAVYLMHNGSSVSADEGLLCLSDERMAAAENYLIRANKCIHRKWPVADHEEVDELKRDCYMVRWAHSVYAIGLFTSDASLLKIGGNLAWPCQMYVDRFLYDQEPMSLCELYMFDLKSESWFAWNARWTRINDVPKPSGIYAVVGNDKLTRAAKQAIDSLWVSPDDDA